jgi:hypothetical protein
MSQPDAGDPPLTIGELRRRLAELGNPWTVDPQLSDEELVRQHPRGAQPEDQVPDELRPAALDPARDLREVLAELPPTNPALRERWRDEGLLAAEGGD